MSKAETHRKALRALIAGDKTLVLPGAHDPVSAMLIERAGFPAAYVGVKAALEEFKHTRNADAEVDRRADIAEFEKFIGYPAFSARAKKYGLA